MVLPEGLQFRFPLDGIGAHAEFRLQQVERGFVGGTFLSGDLCLLLGLALLLLPLLAVELSRPRDGVWGAVVLLLGLVLVTSTDRLRGAPMLAVLCAGLLIARLGSEVGQARWNSLSETEQQRFTSLDHWRKSLQ